MTQVWVNKNYGVLFFLFQNIIIFILFFFLSNLFIFQVTNKRTLSHHRSKQVSLLYYYYYYYFVYALSYFINNDWDDLDFNNLSYLKRIYILTCKFYIFNIIIFKKMLLFFEYFLNYWDNIKFESMKIMDRFILFSFFKLLFFFFFSIMDLFFTLPTSLQNMKDSLIYDYYCY